MTTEVSSKDIELIKILNEVSQKIHQNRSTVLEHYNFIDLGITSVISQYYFGCYNEDFISNVLYSSFMSSAGRIEILRLILKETNLYNKKLVENIQSLAKIRNNFAHGSTFLGVIKAIAEISEGKKPDKLTMFNPKKPSDILNFDCEAEYNKFMVCYKQTENQLAEVYNKIAEYYLTKPEKKRNLKGEFK